MLLLPGSLELTARPSAANLLSELVVDLASVADCGNPKNPAFPIDGIDDAKTPHPILP